jgi:hypothetical protein
MKHSGGQDMDTSLFNPENMMDIEELVKKAKGYILGLFKNNAGGHDAAHSFRVYKNALMIAEKEPSCNIMIVSLAALYVLSKKVIVRSVKSMKVFSRE